MIDLGAILKRSIDFTLPSGKVISACMPKEKDYVTIINLEQEFNKIARKESTTIEDMIAIKNKQVNLIFKGQEDYLIAEAVELNIRIKSIVVNEFIKFIANIDKHPN